MDAKETLEIIIANEGINYNKLAKEMKLKRTQPLYDIRDGKVKTITKYYADKIKIAYPHYNLIWLLTGCGEVFTESSDDLNVDIVTECIQTTVKERLISFLLDSKITRQQFANDIGVSSAYVDSIRKSIQPDKISSIAECYPQLNISWLMTGEGQMFKSEPQQNKEYAQISMERGKPYYNVDFIAGFELVVDDQTRNPEYLIDFEQYDKADCWCNVTGHSMEPEINNGDIIAIKKIKNWSEFLPYGEIYGIITDDFRTIKKVTGVVGNDDYLLLIPTNTAPEYQPQKIRKSMIKAVFHVLGCMKKL